MTIIVERVLVPSPEMIQLVRELDAVLGAMYSAEQRHGLQLPGVLAERAPAERQVVPSAAARAREQPRVQRDLQFGSAAVIAMPRVRRSLRKLLIGTEPSRTIRTKGRFCWSTSMCERPP